MLKVIEEGFCIHRARSYAEMCPVCQGTPCCSKEDLSLESCWCMNLLANNQDSTFDLKRPPSRSTHQWCWFAVSVRFKWLTPGDVFIRSFCWSPQEPFVVTHGADEHKCQVRKDEFFLCCSFWDVIYVHVYKPKLNFASQYSSSIVIHAEWAWWLQISEKRTLRRQYLKDLDIRREQN